MLHHPGRAVLEYTSVMYRRPSLRQTRRRPSELQTAKQSLSKWLPGQNADDRPLILEEEVGLPPAPKEPVAVPFICNLRGFGCRLAARSRLHRGTSTASCLNKSASSSYRRRVCTTQEPGQAMDNTQFETLTMAEVHEGK